MRIDQDARRSSAGYRWRWNRAAGADDHRHRRHIGEESAVEIVPGHHALSRLGIGSKHCRFQSGRFQHPLAQQLLVRLAGSARERLRQEIETENRIEGAGARRKKQRRALQVLYQRFLGDRAEWIVRSKCAFGFAPDTAGMRDEIDQPDGLAVLGRDRLVPAEPRLQRVGELHGTPEYP